MPPGTPDKFRESLVAFFAEHDLNTCETAPDQAMLVAVKKEMRRLCLLLPPALREPQPYGVAGRLGLVRRW